DHRRSADGPAAVRRVPDVAGDRRRRCVEPPAQRPAAHLRRVRIRVASGDARAGRHRHVDDPVSRDHRARAAGACNAGDCAHADHVLGRRLHPQAPAHRRVRATDPRLAGAAAIHRVRDPRRGALARDAAPACAGHRAMGLAAARSAAAAHAHHYRARPVADIRGDARGARVHPGPAHTPPRATAV
ncbi:MAG: hypothetical protein AVDCRST_MAG71-1677, partial [uncultured Lysobacter sp.]